MLLGISLIEKSENRSMCTLKMLFLNFCLIPHFLHTCRSVGTFARALDSTGSLQPSVHVNAACASRDTTQVNCRHRLHTHARAFNVFGLTTREISSCYLFISLLNSSYDFLKLVIFTSLATFLLLKRLLFKL